MYEIDHAGRNCLFCNVDSDMLLSELLLPSQNWVQNFCTATLLLQDRIPRSKAIRSRAIQEVAIHSKDPTLHSTLPRYHCRYQGITACSFRAVLGMHMQAQAAALQVVCAVAHVSFVTLNPTEAASHLHLQRQTAHPLRFAGTEIGSLM